MILKDFRGDVLEANFIFTEVSFFCKILIFNESGIARQAYG